MLNDSFLENERQAHLMAQQDDIHEEPTRDRPFTKTHQPGGKSSQRQRQTINIDENEDTLHNAQDFSRIFERGQKLKEKMDQAMGADAWEKLHGIHNVPKSYIPPFLRDSKQQNSKADPSIRDSQLDNLYALELENQQSEESTPIRPQNRNKQNDIQFEDEQQPENQDEAPSIKQMKFLRLKIKTMRLEDNELLQQLIDSGFNLTVLVPLPDIYRKEIQDQYLKLSNHDVIGFNEFAFNSLSLYNFKVDESTFNKLAESHLKIQIEGFNVSGSVAMNKLLLASKYTLSTTIDLKQTIQLNNQKNRNRSKSNNKQQVSGKKGGTLTKENEKPQPQQVEKSAGTVTIEINLQRGDTEEELERNYNIKLKLIEEQRLKKEELDLIERRRRAMMVCEQNPTFAQLYLHIVKIQEGGLILDQTHNQNNHPDETLARQTNEPTDHHHNPDTTHHQHLNANGNSNVNVNKRNLFIAFKAFPTLEKMQTPIQWQNEQAIFNSRTQFPIMMNPDTVDKLEKWTFVLEVWDKVSPGFDDLVGIVKIPLASFCYSMKTTANDIFSLNFLADQHSLYPISISDEPLPIYSPKLGANVGNLIVYLAMGSAMQVNRQIQKEQEYEHNQKQLQLINQQATIQQNLLQTINQGPSKEEIQAKAEKKARKKLEEEKKKEEDKTKKMANFFRSSIGAKGDLDLRQNTYIGSLRKLFEEIRAQENIGDLNSEEFFKENVKNYDGTVKKDEVIYSLLEKEELTLTRSEVANICGLMLNINRDDHNNVDVDELQYSFQSYIKYYELLEQRILDLLEKFKLSISKKLDNPEAMYKLAAFIEQKATESKLPLSDFKIILEDNHGVIVREALYDQLSIYFDLDRSGTIYITSFCEFLRDPTIKNFNFFKVNPFVLSNQIVEYVKNCISGNSDALKILEKEFKQEIYWKSRENLIEKQKQAALMDAADPDAVQIEQEEIDPDAEPPSDLLLKERINAKLFQFKLKRQGVALSLWEIFTLFEYVNTQFAKVFYEPQRYHYALFEHFMQIVSGVDYRKDIEDQIRDKEAEAEAERERLRIEKEEEEERARLEAERLQREAEEAERKRKEEEEMKLAEDLNLNESDSGIFSLKDGYGDDSFVNDGDDPAMTAEERRLKMVRNKANRDDKYPYRQVKHVFEITIKELKNIPILSKFIRESQSYEQANVRESQDPNARKNMPNQASFIQNVAVKYSFPLDEDEILESDYIQLNKQNLQSKSTFDYKVSMNTVHTYLLGKEDNIQNLISTSTDKNHEFFNLSLVLYQDNREYVIGNAQLPIEDLLETVQSYDEQIGSYQKDDDCSVLNRILFLYGTSYSQRENCIIGKINVEINYQAQRQLLSKTQAKEFDKTNQNMTQSCFMHRETYINRKIPLNAVLSVFVNKVANLKESIENIEHFARVHKSALNEDYDEHLSLDQHSQSNVSKDGSRYLQQKMDQIDRRRILTQILKQGLNLVVMSSVFDEEESLKQKFTTSKHQTRLLFNSLNPVFNESFQLNLQMDTKIFDYLKNKKAVFEVRHYIINGNNAKMVNTLNETADLNRSGSYKTVNKVKSSNTVTSRAVSNISEQDAIMDRHDYIVLGYVRVPLLHLITKNNGIDGEFVILDEYKQKMGTLTLRISLNHHNTQRPLFSASNKLPTQVPQTQQADQRQTLIDKTISLNNSISQGMSLQNVPHKYLLGFNFVEIILHNYTNILHQSINAAKTGRIGVFYLKFRLLGQNYQTKFIASDSLCQSKFMKAINMAVYEVRNTVFVDIDMANQSQVEQAFARPVEIQLWHKVQSDTRFKQGEDDQHIGSFMVELNDLSKYKSHRVKEGPFQVYEGYFTMYDFNNEKVTQERLGLKLYLIQNQQQNQKKILERAFNNNTLNRKQIEHEISHKLDPQSKGYVEVDDLLMLIDQATGEETEVIEMVKSIVKESLEYKNVDSVYYSPLFGLPAPYFKYAKRFDQFGVVEKLFNELSALDSHNTGFVPLGLFRSVLEHELKIKVKIVEDFIENFGHLKTESNKNLDVNYETSKLTSHIDYPVLVRKLIQCLEILDSKTMTGLQTLTQPEELQAATLTFSVSIESAMRLKNPQNNLEPPNAFVRLRMPLPNSEPESIQTDIINQSCYPSWRCMDNKIRVPLYPNTLDQIANNTYPVEFEVYHVDMAQNGSKHSTLIGVAYVDLGVLAHVDEPDFIRSHFQIMKRDLVQNSLQASLMDSSLMQKESLGQLKVTIKCNTSIKKLYQGQIMSSKEFMRSSAQNISMRNPFAQSIQDQSTFGARQQTYISPSNRNAPIMTMQEHNTLHQSSTHLKMAEAMGKVNELLENGNEQEIKDKHTQNMQALEELTKKLNQTLALSHTNEEESNQYSNQQHDLEEHETKNRTNFMFGSSFAHNSPPKRTESPEFKKIGNLEQTSKTDLQQQLLKSQLEVYRMSQNAGLDAQKQPESSSFNPFMSKVLQEPENLENDGAYSAKDKDSELDREEQHVQNVFKTSIDSRFQEQ